MGKLARNILVLGVGIFIFMVLMNFKSSDIVDKDRITLTALGEQNELAEGSEIWLKGIRVDEKLYSAKEIFSEGWIERGDRLGWRIYDQPDGLQMQISGVIPEGTKKEILFESNKWRGKLKITFMDNEVLIDCYQDSEDGEFVFQLPIPISEENTSSWGKSQLYVIRFFWILDIAVLGYAVFSLYFFFRKRKGVRKKKGFSNDRKIWADGVRIFAMFQVVLLHAICEGYTSFFSDLSSWYSFLYMNCFTACAVPLFFMISGNFVIRKEGNTLAAVGQRVKKIVIPLLIWSVIYLVMRKWYRREEIDLIRQIIKIGSEPQYSHLWFIYTLCGVYLASPIISWIYYDADRKLLCYIGIVFGVLPFFFKKLEVMLGYRIGISYMEMFFPEIILFVLGKWIFDRKERFLKKWHFWLVTALLGYAMVVLLTYYYSLKFNTPFKGFFSNYGTIPLFIMYVSIYIMFLQLEPKFAKLSNKIKKIFYLISESCMDIYFIHMLWYMLLEGKSIFGIGFFSVYAKSLGIGFITAIICFILSLISSLIIRRSGYFLYRLEKEIQKIRNN